MLVARRLAAQRIARRGTTTPGELVARMGAIQAQDFGATKWAIGLRLPDGAATDADIERAIAEGTILRTHALRGTWQLIAPADVRWILSLVAPRLVSRLATWRRELDLDVATFRRSRVALARALRDGEHLTRVELAAALRGAGISTAGQRMAYLLSQAELEGLICGGTRRGKQFTYTLLDHRAPGTPAVLDRGQALAELARRYFQTRGPATVDDFVWWSGLSVSDARAGLEAIRSTLASDVLDGRTYWRADTARATAAIPDANLLPAFDEYLVAYRNRNLVLNPDHVNRVNAGGGFLNPCVVVGGRVVGIWRRVLQRKVVEIQLRMFQKPTRAEQQAIGAAAQRYGAFLGLEASIRVTATGR